jgi:triacylglycerol esterase/lipase EstA (alpha/beta hydrolase family)
MPLAVAVLLLLAAGGCTPFVGVSRSADGTAREASALDSDRLSTASRNVLSEYGLLESFDNEPAPGIAQLHRVMVAEDGEPDQLFALAEASYLHARNVGSRPRYLAAAVYAYAFLFADGYGASPSRFDPRLRLAADLYNHALALAFATDDGSAVVPRADRVALPFADIDVAFFPDARRLGGHVLTQFVPVRDLEVRGLAMRYRRPGLGAPLAASIAPPSAPGAPAHDLLAQQVLLPVTLLLRIPDARRALVEGRPLSGTLDLYLAGEPEALTISGERVPLEVEPTAALALGLSKVPVLEREITRFVGIRSGGQSATILASLEPYRPGRIPVVFVHGTFSSAMRWAEMINRLQADPEIRRRYQFWFFTYDSSNPIAYSALRLRRFLTSAAAKLDPHHEDAAMSRMVLIGHSQGGLLVKMMVVDSGNAIWDKVSTVPLDDPRISPPSREILREGLVVTPLPLVRRVVFVSTPHRGSFVAARQLVSGLVRRVVRLPGGLATLAADLARHPDLVVERGFMMPTAIDNMSPRNRFLQALSEIPVAPGVHAHSIISVSTDGPVEEANDGVVEYASAHIDGVDSELVVRSRHSTLSTPATMEEVRRILLLHLAAP